MSVLIKCMEKPEHCGYCRFRYDGICHALQKTQYSMNECPLVVIDDADALIAEYDRVHVGEPGGARKLMGNAPTVDAVPVVRCKDCNHYDDGLCRRWIYAHVTNEDSFCSGAERKEE